MYDIIIVGAGGFGREVYLWAKDAFPTNEFKIKGFISANPKALDGLDIDVGILGNDNTYQVQEKDRFLFAIGKIAAKKRIITNLQNKGVKFLTLIHPTAIVADTAEIGEGVIICPFVTVTDHAQIGDFVKMNCYSFCGHNAKIGKYSILCPYAVVNGYAILEDEVFLSTHATVAPYRKVGFRSKISANSAAMYNIPAHTLVYGVPGNNQLLVKREPVYEE